MTQAYIRELQVRRMPGFESGGLQLAELVAGVNVVFGPNASGKSTLSRGLELTINPQGRGEPWSLAGTLEIEGEPFRLDYNHGTLTCQRQGRPADVPRLAPTDLGRHYLLALHELMQANASGNLAETILREAAGGYDVPTARDAIGAARDRATGKGKLNRALEEAIAHRNASQNAQSELQRQQSQLAQLEEEKQHAAQAREEIISLEQALEWRAAESEATAAREGMAAFAPNMIRLRGDEIERLEQLRTAIAQAEQNLATAGIAQRDAERQQNETLLPEQGLSSVVVAELRGKCRELDNIAADINQLEAAAADAERRRDQALAELGPELSTPQAEEIASRSLEPLHELIRRHEAWRAARVVGDKIESWLPAGESEDPAALREASLLLEQWLGREEAGRQSPRLAIALWIAGGVCTVAAAPLGLLVDGSWWVLLPIGIGLGVGGFFERTLHARRQATSAERLFAEYAALGIEAPAWQASSVRTHLRLLHQRQATAQLGQEKAALRNSLRASEQLAQEGEEIEAVRRAFSQEWGLSLDAEPHALYRLAGALQRWRAAEDTLAGCTAKLKKRNDQVKARLAAIVEQLDQYGSARPRDPAAALAHVEQLAERGVQHREATATLQQACQRSEELAALLKRLRGEQEQLFRKLELDPQAETAEHTLRDWCGRLEDFRQARHALEKAEAVCESRAQALAQRGDLLALSADELADRRQQAQRQCEPLEELTQRIWKIEEQVKQAQASHDLEAALAQVEDCRDTLRQQRESDVLAAIGHTLAEHLIGQQKEEAQGGVLQRAAKLFTRFTHGRYKLQIEPGAKPRFRAVDTDRGQGQELDELSSGTRIQLLLAVRVAYIEEHERGCRLPLVFDETLGNSDERRAREIIEAAIEIALSGRQVIYFTAQNDEVLKWRHYCDREDSLSYHEIDLAAERKFGKDERLPAWDYKIIEAEIEQPNGDDFLAYGRRLEVPPLDRRGDLGGVHLWYLVEDLEQLHTLLAGGVNKWGQLENLVEHGQAEGLDRQSPVFAQAAAAAEYLGKLLEKWHVGRGRPLDRVALENSGAITPSFIEEVAGRCAKLQGDGKALLADLESGGVKRFRTDSRDKLRDWLISEQYIDERDTLSTEELREAVAPLAFTLHQQGLLSASRRDFLFAAVCGQAETATSRAP